MKRILTYILLIWSVGIFAQPRFVVDQESKKVGEILFQNPVDVVFVLKNKGKSPLEILSVKTSCSCTMVDYPKTAIKPGETCKLTMRYDAEMLGTFHKEVAVYTNVRKEPYFLTMQGRVVTEKTDFESDFPIDLGNVRIDVNYIEFDNVNKGKYPTAEIRIVNVDRNPYRPQIMHLPSYLKAEYVPEIISGGKIGKVVITLDSEKLDAYGLTQRSIYLSRGMGDKIGEENEINTSAVLLPAFSDMTESQMANAPRLLLSSDEIHFSNISGKKKLSQTINVKNEGKNTLNIKGIQVFNRAVGVSLSNRAIEPGKSARLKVTVTPAMLKKGKARPRILIISDDPKNAAKTINIQL